MLRAMALIALLQQREQTYELCLFLMSENLDCASYAIEVLESLVSSV